MKNLSILAPSFLVLALAACEEKSSAPQATVAPAKTVAAQTISTAAAANPAAAGTYLFSSDGSKLEWTGAKVTAKHDGSFSKFSGSIDIPASGNPEEGKVVLDIDMASLRVEPAKLMGHLKSPDLLDVAKYPTAKFTSTQVKAGGSDGATHTITGNLELHGVTKSISFPAKIAANGDTVTATAAFQINRKDFGIVYPGMPDDLIKDSVVIRFEVKGAKNKS